MSVLALKYLPYLAAALLLAGGGFWTGLHLADLRWQAKYNALQTADATARANGEEAVRKDLESKLRQAQAISTNNADSLVRLANENATLAADRDANVALARRLLSQARPTPSSGVVSQAGHQPATPAASGTGQDDSLAQLVTDVGDECTRNADRLDTLVAQLKPQL